MTGARGIEVDGHHVPEPLKEYDVWVVWCPDLGKTARAPWQEGHMYPAEWAASKPVNPRTTYSQASATATLPLDELADRYPFPPDANPRTVEPTILIPPATTDNDLLFADFDDVIVDGEITEKAWKLLQRLGGYAEVSRSYNDPDKRESGAHAWVRGSLPDGYGKFIADLEERGQIELYDRGRMTGCTWQHIEGTPIDTIPEAQGAIDGIVDTYADEEAPPKPDGGTAARANRTTVNSHGPTKDNPYFELSIRDVADTGAFSMYRKDADNPAHDDWQGPHPKHGGTSSKDRKSTNFHVDTADDCWHCFAHDSGGGTLALIAVLEGIVNCRHADRIHNDREKLLQACLAARDEYAPGLEGETPPYDALIAVAEAMGLDFAEPESDTLGDTSYNVAKRVYRDMNY
jgi:hypothetical protein